MSASAHSVVVFHNAEKPQARRELPRLTRWFRKKGIPVLPPARAAKATLAVALGGDGTLLRAARFLAPKGIPVLGVNMGRLGFLSGTDLKHMYRTLDSLLSSKLALSHRMMLCAKAPNVEEKWALNDCVIRVGTTARAIRLSVWVDNAYLGTFVGDGIILSTPTGSTAYSLAAAGPIANPEMDLILLTPVCAHSLTQRPLILPWESVLKIRVEERNSKDRVFMSLDGQTDIDLKSGSVVTVRRAPERFKIYFDPDVPFFSVLRQKLKWGEQVA
jgi:NAD+ kinase